MPRRACSWRMSPTRRPHSDCWCSIAALRRTVTDRRRIGVLIFGIATGAAAAAGVIVRLLAQSWRGYLRDDAHDAARAGIPGHAGLVRLRDPASPPLRSPPHRPPGAATTRWRGKSVDALVPVLGALLLADVILHRDQPLVSLLTTRGWWYLLIAGALLLVRSHREEWLTRVDRRFFRERYDAHRLLTSIAEQVGRASSFDVIAPSIAQQIDEALHPTFVSVLTHLAASSSFSSDAAPVPKIRSRRPPDFADRDQGALGPAQATGAVARRYRLGSSSTPAGGTDPAAGIRDRAPRADLGPLWRPSYRSG